jgi:signal transduction histidine kinase
MKTSSPAVQLIQIMRTAIFLWIFYLVMIGLIDALMVTRNHFPILFRLYYLPQVVYALISLVLAYSPWIHTKLQRFFLPVMIVLNALPPMISNALIVPLLPDAPTLTPEGIALRTTPVVTLSLIMIAWNYPWKLIMLFFFSFSTLRVIYLLVRIGPDHDTFYPSILVTVIQIVSFVTIGYVFTRLIAQLRDQQQSLHDANAQLKHYASTLEQLAVSRERNRIARELHDTLAHTLSGLSVQLESVKAYWEVDPKASLAMLDKSLTATRTGLEETRRVLKAVRASPLEDLGLGLAITQTAKDTATRANLALDLVIPESLMPISPDVEQCIYRVAQEAMANVMYHANATCLQVHLKQQDARIMLRINDDGLGFDPRNRKKSGHFGLTGMYERADLMGGSLSVESEPGQGTTVQLTI